MKQLLTIPEVAIFLNVSKKTIYRMIFDGTLAALKIRESLRVKTEDLERLINEARDNYEIENGFNYDFFRENENNGTVIPCDGLATLTSHNKVK